MLVRHYRSTGQALFGADLDGMETPASVPEPLRQNEEEVAG
jgi:hypothetical protein